MLGTVVYAHDPQVVQASPRQAEQEAVDSGLILGQIDSQEQGRKRLGDRPIGAFGTARVVDDRRTDRGEAIDELQQQHSTAMGELLSAKPIDGEAQDVGLVFLAGPDAGVATRMRGRRADPTRRPLGRLVSSVAPVFVIVGNRPAAIQVPPDRRVGIGQGLGSHLADKGRTQAGEVTPVSLRPPESAAQVLVAAANDHRARGVQRPEHARRVLVDVTIQLFGVALPQPCLGA